MREYCRYSLALLFLFLSVYLHGQLPNCQADYSYTQSGNTVSFTNNSSATSQILYYYWDFGDGSSGTSANATHTYAQAGIYGPCLSILTADSCYSVHCDTVVVPGGGSVCQAAFAVTSISASGFQFTNNSTASAAITSYLWDFGDGSYSALASPSHAYASPGYYAVCLTITTADNCTSTLCDTVSASSGCGTCQADFNYTINGPTVSFTDASTGSSAIGSWYWDFGDGSFSYSQNPAHAYTVSSTFVICLTITTVDSCVSTWCDSIAVTCGTLPTCQADFNYVQDTTNGTVYFIDQSIASGNIAGWYWDFGDGSTSYQQNPNHIYNQSGSYLACLTIYTSDSCTSTYCDSVVVNNPCQCGPASFTYTVSGNTVSFTNTSQGCYAYSGWTLGNGATSSQTNPVYTYPGPGSYPVCLCIYDSNNNLCDIVCQTIQIGSPCNINAGWTYQVSGNTVFFQNQTTGGANYYDWIFGSSGNSNAVNPVHTFPGPGTYTVCLLAYDTTSSCVDTLCQSITISGCNAQAAFTYTISGNTVFFQNQSTGPGINEWWINGNLSYQTNPVHTFPGPGTYWVCLTVRDSAWTCSDSLCTTITIGGGCQADYIYYQDSITGGIQFFDQSTGSSNIVSWYWDFGDGSTSYQQNPNHIYNQSGSYLACLTIYTSDSCSSTYCDSVVVNNPCQCGPASFTYTVSGNTVSFTNTSQGCYAYSGWTLGNGATSSQTNPVYTYPGPGSYPVCLCIYDSNNNLCDIVCQTIQIGSPCNINAGWTYQVSGNTVFFQNQTTGGANYYDWIFGSSGNSNAVNPVHTFPGPGTYTVCLLAYDTTSSCVDTLCQTVTVSGCNAQAAFTYTVSGNTVSFQNQSTGPGINEWWINGNLSYQTNPVHTFPGPGTYWVCLTVRDSAWTCYDSLCTTITIGGCNANAAFTYTISGNTVSFQNQSTGPGISQWWFGTSTGFSYQTNPTYTYPGPGVYQVCLTVRDSAWTCYDSLCTYITIGGGCQANANFNWTRSGNTVSFYNTGPVNPNFYYFWAFGDGGYGYQANPVHTYPGPGTYTVVCQAYDSLANCFDSTLAVVTIPAGPRVIGGEGTLMWNFTTFPNPTNRMSSLQYELAEEAKITIRVFSMDGRLVKSLREEEVQRAGTHTIEFDATELPAGIYLYDVRGGDMRQGVRFVKE